MPRPLDRLHVDSLLSHLVQRGHLAEAVYLADDAIDDVIDFLLRREAAEAEADAAMGQFVADAECSQDVTRFQAGARAGRAARHGYVLDAHH